MTTTPQWVFLLQFAGILAIALNTSIVLEIIFSNKELRKVNWRLIWIIEVFLIPITLACFYFSWLGTPK